MRHVCSSGRLYLKYASNLEKRLDIGRLCRRVLREVLATGLFEVGAVRIRAICREYYAVGGEAPDNTFIDTSFRIRAGRSLDDRKRSFSLRSSTNGL